MKTQIMQLLTEKEFVTGHRRDRFKISSSTWDDGLVFKSLDSCCLLEFSMPRISRYGRFWALSESREIRFIYDLKHMLERYPWRALTYKGERLKEPSPSPFQLSREDALRIAPDIAMKPVQVDSGHLQLVGKGFGCQAEITLDVDAQDEGFDAEAYMWLHEAIRLEQAVSLRIMDSRGEVLYDQN